MPEDLGFTFIERNNEFQIFHHGKKATTLRGQKAADFRDEVESSDFAAQQQLMARLTGNYKHGNERQARNHPRNRRF